MGKKVIAIILGGGQGTRLNPLTYTRSKPAVPIAGKYRLVDIPISNCINSGILQIFVLTQFNSASLNRHIKNSYRFGDFCNSFVDILAAEQTPQNGAWFQGTADAVRKSMKHIVAYDFDFALILSGDQLYQMDFNQLLDEHLQKNADISLATLPVIKQEATDFGILKTDSESYITEFIEKPAADILPEWTSQVSKEMNRAGKNYLASMGIYVFNRDVLISLLADESRTDFGKEIIPEAIQSKKVLSYQYEGYWTDIGSIASFFEANLKLTDDIPEFNLFDNQNYIYTRARLLPPSKISGTTLIKTIISDGCIIHASKIEHALIGIRSRIGKSTVIENAIIMGATYYQDLHDISKASNTCHLIGIGERCYINNTIVDKNCAIGNDVRINGGKHLKEVDTPEYTIREGIVIIKKGACIPDGFTL